MVQKWVATKSVVCSALWSVVQLFANKAVIKTYGILLNIYFQIANKYEKPLKM